MRAYCAVLGCSLTDLWVKMALVSQRWANNAKLWLFLTGPIFWGRIPRFQHIFISLSQTTTFKITFPMKLADFMWRRPPQGADDRRHLREMGRPMSIFDFILKSNWIRAVTWGTTKMHLMAWNIDSILITRFWYSINLQSLCGELGEEVPYYVNQEAD